MNPDPAAPPQAPRIRRRWLRLSLRGLMALILVLGIALGYGLNLVRVQREAVQAIQRTGGGVQRRWITMPFSVVFPGMTDNRPWLLRWLDGHVDPDYFDPVIRVDLGERAGNAEMDHVARLSQPDPTGVAVQQPFRPLTTPEPPWPRDPRPWPTFTPPGGAFASASAG